MFIGTPMISDMYKAFYGLNDNPFSIAPNPHYFFLSDRHKEALAHLTYGLGETGGFILLTGEVGTGKTTVSRCLISQLSENTDTAFILNPSLNDTDLLASLCDELQIPYSDNPQPKELTDCISQFLLKNHENGRQTILIIDEAQHLNAEVLEQLRLLTNLETDTEKLLQVILIGQPELQLLLKRAELRQLAQRISARYHLLPLSQQEIQLYVHHRLQVAGRLEPLFTKSAFKELYTISQGVPRIINLVCERALMAGYVQSKELIDKQMIRVAALEILGKLPQKNHGIMPIALAISFVLTFAMMFYLIQNYDETVNKYLVFNDSEANIQQKLINDYAHNNHANQLSQQKQNKVVIEQFNRAIDNSRNLTDAYSILLSLWGKTPYKGMDTCDAAREQALDCLQQQGNIITIENLNYPAVAHLRDDNGKAFFATVVSRNSQEILLQLSEKRFWVTRSWFNKHFTGYFEVMWKPLAGIPTVISPKSSLSDLQWLDTGLASIDNKPSREVNGFDRKLRSNIENFQRQNGLIVDGMAGANTLQLLTLYLSQDGPRLTEGDQG